MCDLLQLEEYSHTFQAIVGLHWASVPGIAARFVRDRLFNICESLSAHRALSRFSSLVKLDNSDSKAEPDLKPLAGLRQTDLILHLWQKYSSTALVPLTANAIAVRRQMANANTAVVSRLEAKVNAILQRTIECKTVFPFSSLDVVLTPPVR
jgi:hypothetical protein